MIVFGILLACAPDDWNGDDYVPDTSVDTTDTSDTSSGDGLVGNWRSEGADLSPLFAGDPFNYAHVDALFHGDGTYRVDAVVTAGDTYTLTGTYTTDEGTDPAWIELHQLQPQEALAEGIYRVAGDVLTYEIVPTSPVNEFVPPTSALGFGSTSGPNMDEGINVQTYRRR